MVVITRTHGFHVKRNIYHITVVTCVIALIQLMNEDFFKMLHVRLWLGRYGKTDTIRIAIRTKQYAIRIDDTIQR